MNANDNSNGKLLRKLADIDVPDLSNYREKHVESMCFKKGCINIAVNEAVWKLKNSETDAPIISTPIARLCIHHSHDNLWNEFYNKESWDIMRDAIEGMGRKKPKKKFSSVHVQPIGTSKKSMPKF